MYVYDILAGILIGISHVLLYLQLIRYQRLSYPMIIALSILFTTLLAIVVTVTGYPELNLILIFFLLSLGLMQEQLSFAHSLYFALASMVSITLVKLVFMEISMFIFMESPFNLYLWTGSLIHMIVTIVILISIVLLKNQTQRLARFMVEPLFYMISYLFFVFGIVVVVILSSPSSHFLAILNQQYGQLSYILAIILFLILLLMILIGFHLTKERMHMEQQERLDKELLDYVEKLEVLHDELASFRHDYMNVLLTLNEGVRTKNLALIEHIYDEVIAPTSKLINNNELDITKLSRIEIPEVKSVLSVKLIAAEQLNIVVMIDIPHVIRKCTVPLVDFIRMISIVVDNAIEEAAQSKDKMVQLAFFEVNEIQYFIVKNSSCHQSIDIEQIYEKRYSSKEGNRGYGLFTLKGMIDKTVNATLETSFEAPYFIQKLIFKKSDS